MITNNVLKNNINRKYKKLKIFNKEKSILGYEINDIKINNKIFLYNLNFKLELNNNLKQFLNKKEK